MSNKYTLANEPLYPTHYTVQEGGIWREWKASTFGPVTRLDLLNTKMHVDKTRSSLSTIDILGIKVHSLSFANINNNIRWDCINGWTHL